MERNSGQWNGSDKRGRLRNRVLGYTRRLMHMNYINDNSAIDDRGYHEYVIVRFCRWFRGRFASF